MRRRLLLPHLGTSPCAQSWVPAHQLVLPVLLLLLLSLLLLPRLGTSPCAQSWVLVSPCLLLQVVGPPM